MRITKIQDDGERFIIHGDGRLLQELKDVFDNMALGVSVTPSEKVSPTFCTLKIIEILF